MSLRATLARASIGPRHVFAALASLFVCAGAASAQCLPGYLPSVSYSVPGPLTVSLIARDFNGDGRLDLGFISGSNFTVLPGNANGTFQPALNSPCGSASQATAADIDGDTILDAVLTRFTNPGFILIMRGNGNGTFQTPTLLATGTFPYGVAIADLNGDGRPDIVSPSGGFSMSVFLGTGGGNFAPKVDYPTAGVSSGQGVVIRDVNNDGKLDVLTAGNGLGVFFGNGNGTLQAISGYGAGTVVSKLTVSDFTSDGLPDAVIQGNSGLYLLRNNGNGTFQSPVFVDSFGQPGNVTSADFNNDGKMDLATACLGVSGTSTGRGGVIVLGNGNGTFQPATSYPAATTNPQSVASGDFNGDGRADLAVGAEAMFVILSGQTNYPAPTITTQPTAGQSLYQGGQTVTLTAVVNGQGNTLTHQWRKNGVALPPGPRFAGTTSATLSITLAISSDTGSYDLVATTPACGGGTLPPATTNTVLISVTDSAGCGAPSLTTQPASTSVIAGQPAAFGVAAPGSGLSYQWRLNGANVSNGVRPSGATVSGSTSATLTIGGATLSEDGVVIDCVVSTSCGSTRSNAASLRVNRFQCNLADITSVGGLAFDPDGQLTVDDLILYVNSFTDGCP